MMKNGNMPAMPLPLGTETEKWCQGLTKREVVAMHMMQGLISAWGQHDVTCFSQLANDAVLAADELLAELDTKCQKS